MADETGWPIWPISHCAMNGMTDGIVIRPAHDGDHDFVVGLQEFGSAAWEDVKALAPGFRDVTARAVSVQGPVATVLIAQGAEGAPLGAVERGELVGRVHAEREMLGLGVGEEDELVVFFGGTTAERSASEHEHEHEPADQSEPW